MLQVARGHWFTNFKQTIELEAKFLYYISFDK